MTRAYGREDKGLQDTLDGIKLKANRDILRKYANEKIANGNLVGGLAHKMYTFRLFSNTLNIPFDKATKDDLVKLLSHKEFNKVYYKKLLKQFYRWIKDDDSPKITKWIKVKATPEEIREKRPKVILNEQQAYQILTSCDHPMDRALLEVLADNPTRPRDLENLRVKDVKIDEFGVILSFSSKTVSGKRDVFLQNSRVAFLKYWEMHPYKDNPNAPVFYSLGTNSYGQPLLWGGMNTRLRRIVNRTKLPQHLKDNVTLYTLRRTSATWLLSNPDFTPKEVQRMGGWSSIRMLDVYGKTTDEMVNKKKLVLDAKERKDKHLIASLKQQSKSDSMLAKLMAKHGLLKEAEKVDLLGTKQCPRCETNNLSDTDFCSRCWLPMKRRTANIKEKVIKKGIEWQKPFNKALVKEIVKEMIKKGEI